MKDDKKEVMGTEEPFEEQELIHTQDFESPQLPDATFARYDGALCRAF